MTEVDLPATGYTPDPCDFAPHVHSHIRNTQVFRFPSLNFVAHRTCQRHHGFSGSPSPCGGGGPGTTAIRSLKKSRTWSRGFTSPSRSRVPHSRIPKTQPIDTPIHWSLRLDLIWSCFTMAPHATGKTPIKIPGKRTRSIAKKDVATQRNLVRALPTFPPLLGY